MAIWDYFRFKKPPDVRVNGTVRDLVKKEEQVKERTARHLRYFEMNR